MADDVFTEEIELGSTSTVINSQPQDIPIGEVTVEGGGSGELNIGQVTIGAATTPSLSTTSAQEATSVLQTVNEPAPTGAPNVVTPAGVSVDDLRKVYDAVSSCKSINEIMAMTNFTYQKVLICLNYLKETGLVAQDDKLFCSLNAVRNLQKQLTSCYLADCPGKK